MSAILPRPAATLILARDVAGGMEVLMLRRSTRADFIAGAYVFPGGAVSAEDHDADLISNCGEHPDAEHPAFRLCAIRECFEEAGLLLAHDAAGAMLELDNSATQEKFAKFRQSLNSGKLGFAELCQDQGLLPATAHLLPFGHWITPLGAPKRFDTRYFLAMAPGSQSPSHDEAETIAHVWVRPADALAQFKGGEIELVFPTIKTLEKLVRFDAVTALIDHVKQQPFIETIQPRLARGRAGIRPVGPDEGAYAEIGKLDPEGRISASYEILPGQITRISPRVTRITANNASYMTGPGTNTYLLGAGDEIAVIDPGPADPIHVQRLVAEAPGRIRWILATHTHPDHSPAAALLQAQTGAEVWGLPPSPGASQDASFRPRRTLADGEQLQVAGCTLRVLHTPGHAANHLCFFLEEERLLFTGDHIMQGSTVVINPPDGDMAAYLASLCRLQSEDIAYLAPAHGFLMDHAPQVIAWLLTHRRQREAKICNALEDLTEASTAMLLALAYADVPVAIHPLAERSLLAHLIKLEAEERITSASGLWRAIRN